MATEVRTEIDPAIKAYIDERLAEIGPRVPDNRVSLAVFSGELDRQLASLVIATGAAAMGMEVSIFYTFWGLSALTRQPLHLVPRHGVLFEFQEYRDRPRRTGHYGLF